jgi:hypothetical protein
MNNSNAAAKKRRAGIQPNTLPESMSQPTTPQNTTGLTLPQVIAVIDQSLINLESFVKESKGSENVRISSQENGEETGEETGIVMDTKEFSTFVDEINNRFQMLADEINSLKDTVLKLQGYTMDVNKILLCEITKNEDGEMPTICLGESENAKFMLESMKTTKEEIMDEIPTKP